MSARRISSGLCGRVLELHDRLQERTRRELDYFEAEIECHYNSEGISDLQAEIEIFGRLISDLWRRRYDLSPPIPERGRRESHGR